jgi:uncharacterized membrane protein YedE/YeeE
MGCHDAPMSEPSGTHADTGDDTSIRLAGFGLTALGGLLIGVGSLMPWVRSSLEGLPEAISPTYLGVDLPDGLICLAAAAVVLVGLATTRLASSPRARRVAAGAVVAASFVAFAVAGAAIITATARFEATAVDDIMGDLDPSGNASQEQREQVEELVVTQLAPGPFAVLGGGVLGVVGGVLLLSWSSRATRGADPRSES